MKSLRLPLRLLSPALLLAAFAASFTAPAVRADENLFGYVFGAETLPKGHYDFYETGTARTGKDSGDYLAWDSETEIEYGFTDKFQGILGIDQHYFDIKGVAGLANQDRYRFGGLSVGGKYRFLSPFKDGYGLALRVELAFHRFDEVAGVLERETLFAPTLAWQKNFLDDTLITSANLGFGMTWGKRPAEQYDYELALVGGLGASYRFAPNWFFGLEAHARSEYPEMNISRLEHGVLFAGPSLHYAARRWWTTLSWANQIYGYEVGETTHHYAFAEQALNEFRLKFGLNF
jgi:hypothetical protein